MNDEIQIPTESKVELKSGFVLFGTITDRNNAGIWLKTKTEHSFISYDLIEMIRQKE